jgi:hypothetical protein
MLESYHCLIHTEHSVLITFKENFWSLAATPFFINFYKLNLVFCYIQNRIQTGNELAGRVATFPPPHQELLRNQQQSVTCIKGGSGS